MFMHRLALHHQKRPKAPPAEHTNVHYTLTPASHSLILLIVKGDRFYSHMYGLLVPFEQHMRGPQLRTAVNAKRTQ